MFTISSWLICRGGTVESRIRTLVQDLENDGIIVTAHPLIYGISMPFFCLTDEEQAAASQGELSEAAMRRTEEDMVGKEYKKVWTKSFFVGLEIEKKPSKLDPFRLCREKLTHI